MPDISHQFVLEQLAKLRCTEQAAYEERYPKENTYEGVLVITGGPVFERYREPSGVPITIMAIGASRNQMRHQMLWAMRDLHQGTFGEIRVPEGDGTPSDVRGMPTSSRFDQID